MRRYRIALNRCCLGDHAAYIEWGKASRVERADRHGITTPYVAIRKEGAVTAAEFEQSTAAEVECVSS
jgi:hypothetical protein